MFFLIDSACGVVKKAAETIEELKYGVDPDTFSKEGAWIMKAEVVDGNFIVPVKDLVGHCMIHDLFKSYDDEQVRAY